MAEFSAKQAEALDQPAAAAGIAAAYGQNTALTNAKLKEYLLGKQSDAALEKVKAEHLAKEQEKEHEIDYAYDKAKNAWETGGASPAPTIVPPLPTNAAAPDQDPRNPSLFNASLKLPSADEAIYRLLGSPAQAPAPIPMDKRPKISVNGVSFAPPVDQTLAKERLALRTDIAAGGAADKVTKDKIITNLETSKNFLENGLDRMQQPVVTNQMFAGVVSDYAKAMSGAAVSAESRQQAETYHSLQGKLANYAQYASGNPQDAVPAGIKEKFIQDMKATRDLIAQHMESHAQRIGNIAQSAYANPALKNAAKTAADSYKRGAIAAEDEKLTPRQKRLAELKDKASQ